MIKYEMTIEVPRLRLHAESTSKEMLNELEIVIEEIIEKQRSNDLK